MTTFFFYFAETMDFLGILALIGMLIGLGETQFFPSSFNLISEPQPSFIEFAENQGRRTLAHHAVVENAIQESQLPQELLNPFYKNPVIAAGLAKESLITNKEFAVFNRDTEKIPRSEILKIFQRAGFHDRNRRK